MSILVKDNNINVIESRVSTGQGRRLIWHWYWIDGGYVVKPALAKLYQAKNNLADGDRRAAFIALSSPLDQDVESVRARMRALLEEGEFPGPVLEGAEVRRQGEENGG